MKKWQTLWLAWEHTLRSHIERIYVREDVEQAVNKEIKKRTAEVACLFVCAVLAFVYCYCQQPESSVLNGNKLTRKEEDADIAFTVQGKDVNGTIQKEMVFHVEAKEFTKREQEKLAEKVGSYLEEKIRGRNESLRSVQDNLMLVSSVPDTGVSLTWTTDDIYLSEKGELIKRAIPDNGVQTEVQVTASWKNWKETYYFPVFLEKPQYGREEQFENEVANAVESALEKEKEEKVVTLPNKVGGKAISYETKEEETSYALVYVVIFVILLLPVFWRQQQKSREEKREQQLLLDHSGMVNQFMLLLGAGLTVRKIVERLTSEYERLREKGGERRYVYEEMCVMLQEMKDGVSERTALEHFGKRCKLLPYMRFTSVLTQNLKKGAEGILEILEKESMEALEQRKERLLQLGEQAGTKLLFPMILMLGIVMSIIMVPAFMTM